MKCNMYVVCYDAYGYQLILFFFIHEYEVGCDIPVVKIWLGFPVYITAIYSVYDSMTMDLLTIIHLCIYRYTISQIMVMLSCTWFAFSMICPYMSITCMAIIFTVICTKWYCPIFHCDYAHIILYFYKAKAKVFIYLWIRVIGQSISPVFTAYWGKQYGDVM